MFPAVDDGDAVSEEVHFGLLESAIMSGVRAFLVLQLIRFAEACTFRGCALEIVRKQAGDDAVINACTLSPLAFHVDHVCRGLIVRRRPMTLLRMRLRDEQQYRRGCHRPGCRNEDSQIHFPSFHGCAMDFHLPDLTCPIFVPDRYSDLAGAGCRNLAQLGRNVQTDARLQPILFSPHA
jgi:hypothetical protein